MIAKLTRFATSMVLPVDAGRVGSCLRCGACCRLPFKCLFLGFNDAGSYCKAYHLRPPSCRKYPRSESEHLTKASCGFRFVR